jgi:hypothetical protein
VSWRGAELALGWQLARWAERAVWELLLSAQRLLGGFSPLSLHCPSSTCLPADTYCLPVPPACLYRRYRLSVPTSKYSPWFGVVLKGARLSVKVLQLLSQETRASKLRWARAAWRCKGCLAVRACVVCVRVRALPAALPAGCLVQRLCRRPAAACTHLPLLTWRLSVSSHPPRLPVSARLQLQRHCQAPGCPGGD